MLHIIVIKFHSSVRLRHYILPYRVLHIFPRRQRGRRLIPRDYFVEVHSCIQIQHRKKLILRVPLQGVTGSQLHSVCIASQSHGLLASVMVFRWWSCLLPTSHPRSIFP